MTAIAQVAPIAGPEFAPTRARLAAWIARIGAILRQLGPYAAIEILLPGGTLMALLLWFYRRSVDVRARARTSESAAHAYLCMECGVANGHFDLGSAVKLRAPKETAHA
jgi:hypothetical protein